MSIINEALSKVKRLIPDMFEQGSKFGVKFKITKPAHRSDVRNFEIHAFVIPIGSYSTTEDFAIWEYQAATTNFEQMYAQMEQYFQNHLYVQDGLKIVASYNRKENFLVFTLEKYPHHF